jgi:hypothetical protein
LSRRRRSYRKQRRAARGLLRRYIGKMTGRSQAQVTRLVGRHLKHSEVRETSYRRHRFQSRFTRADIELLAKADEAHERPSGPATKKILEREWQLYQRVGFERLATISVARLMQEAKRKPFRGFRSARARENRGAWWKWRAPALGDRSRDSHISATPATGPLFARQLTRKSPRKERSACPIQSLQARPWIRKSSAADDTTYCGAPVTIWTESPVQTGSVFGSNGSHPLGLGR